MLKRHLDRVYALCSQCATGVAAELERKHKVIEHMSIAKRIAESAKNNIRKVRPTLSSLHCNLLSRALAVPPPDAYEQADISIVQQRPASLQSSFVGTVVGCFCGYHILCSGSPHLSALFTSTSAHLPERLYAKIKAESDEEGVGEELLVERWLLVLLRCPFLLKDALCYLALSLFPLDLMLAACRPKGALLPHKHTPQLFVEVRHSPLLLNLSFKC